MPPQSPSLRGMSAGLTGGASQRVVAAG